MLKRASLLLFLFFIFINTFSQQNNVLDSLKKELLKNTSAKNKIDILNELSWQYSSSQFTQAKKYAKKSIELSKRINDLGKLSDSYNRLALAYDYKGVLDSAIHYYNIALTYRKLLLDQKGIANILNNIGACYYYQSYYDSALVYYIKASKIRAYISDSVGISESYNNIGLVFRTQKEYKKAEKYYLKSLSIKKMLKNQRGMMNSYANLSILSMYLDSNTKAVDYSKKALEIAKHLNDSMEIGSELSNLGIAYLKTNQLNTALNYLLKGEKIIRKLKNKQDLAQNINNIGNIYFKYKNLKKAKKYYLESLMLAKELNRKELQLSNLSKLATIENKLKNYKVAFGYATEYNTLYEKVFNRNKSQLINGLETKYETEKKEKEIIELKNKNLLKDLRLKKENLRIKIAIIITAIAIGILILIFYLYLSKKKILNELELKNNLIKKSLSEKETLLKEIHHRVKNNLQIITGLLELQESLHDNKEIGSVVAEAQGRIKTMAIIHEMLYQTDDITNINLKNYVQLLVNSIENGFSMQHKKVNKTYDLEDVCFNIDTIVPLGLILNELVSNSYKYVFILDKGNYLKISIKNTAQENWKLIVTDDGDGVSNDGKGDRQGSFGLRLVKMLVRQLKGEMEYTWKEGAVFCITFKELNLYK